MCRQSGLFACDGLVVLVLLTLFEPSKIRCPSLSLCPVFNHAHNGYTELVVRKSPIQFECRPKWNIETCIFHAALVDLPRQTSSHIPCDFPEFGLQRTQRPVDTCKILGT